MYIVNKKGEINPFLSRVILLLNKRLGVHLYLSSIIRNLKRVIQKYWTHFFLLLIDMLY